MTLYRRRSVLLAAAAALLLVVSLISGRGGSGGGTVEPMVQIVLIRRPLMAGARIEPADLAVSSVPRRWADPHQLSDPAAAVGRRSAVPLPAGAPLIDSELAPNRAPSQARDVAVRLDEVAGLPGGDLVETIADLYLVMPGRPPRIRLVIREVLVVASSSADGAMVATLRVADGDVAMLIEAESAGSLRLVRRAQ
jgi:Flp pilus assembly protein CpaB